MLAAVGPWLVRKRRGRFASPEASRADISLRLRKAAEDLGPTYIKLGQIISSGEGLFPEELVREFKLCRDQVRPEPFHLVRDVVEADLGATLEATFEWFDREPLAAASIAQVHAARLRTGEPVVVKVQRPSVATLVRKDLRAMAWLAPHLVGRIPIAALANPPALVELFAETITEELDFRLEAENMLDVARVLADLGQRGYVIPRPHPTLVTRRVLVMERLEGFAFDDVDAMKAAGIDTTAVVRTGMIAFMEGAMIHGVFHGDLHGGNLFVMRDGRTALLDFGIVGRLTGQRRLAFLRLMLGATTNDVKGQLAALRDLGALPPDTDLRAVIADLGLDRPAVDPTTLTADELVKEVQRIVRALLGYGARMPKELMLYVKNLVFLDGAIARLAPDLDLLGEIAAHLRVLRADPRRAARPGAGHRPHPGGDQPRRREGQPGRRRRRPSGSPTATSRSAAPSSTSACRSAAGQVGIRQGPVYVATRPTASPRSDREENGEQQMPIAVGDRIPEVELRTLGDAGPQKVSSTDVLGKGKVVLFAVPGAFTPGCSKVHLPGFVSRANELTAKGVDTIACIAINDAWVMDAWAQDQQVGDKITMLSDDGSFTEAMGLVMDGSAFGLGQRSQRYAAVIEDGVITHLDVEQGGGIQVSSCEAVLERL